MILKKKKKKPLISIITVTKNSSKTIKRCLNSLKKQKFKNFVFVMILFCLNVINHIKYKLLNFSQRIKLV